MLWLTLLACLVAFFALFWGGSLVAQGYLYNQPADMLPLRAAIAAVLVGGFITMWVAIDRRTPGKYDTFFEFAGERTHENSEFEAIRWQAIPSGNKIGFKKKDQSEEKVEITSRVKRTSGKSGGFVDELTGKTFALNGSMPDGTQYLTGAVIARDEDGNPVRFNADVKEDDRSGAIYVGEVPTFKEPKGTRYIRGDQMGRVIIPSTGTVALALLVNAMLFVVWFIAGWPILRFNWGHALGLAAVFGLLSMLVLMPLLFKQHRTPKEPAPASARLLRPGECIYPSLSRALEFA